ncbi:MAG: elongator complex protein 3 [Oscillospiraceae bacterium]|jgi:histone acetyltransferase (RNA polymerase elongator complex component)
MSARRNIIPVFVPHLGCPNDCVFCNQRRISGSLAPATAESVVSAIREGIRRIPPGEDVELAFYGGSFTAIPAREQEKLLGSALPFLRDGAIKTVRLSTRPDAIDEETLRRLASFGVTTIELGAQSMSDRVLELSGRGHTSADTVRAAEMIKNAGFNLILQMMTGLPGDDNETALETARKIAALRPDGVRIYPTVIIRDTDLFDMWKRGEYAEHTVEDAVRLCARILPVFRAAGIPVIRLGLNPTDELSGGSVAGGAYHPAFGELVRSYMMLNEARKLLRDVPRGSHAVLGVHKSRVSAMVGQKRANIDTLMAEFGLKSLKVRVADVEMDSIKLLSVAID